MIDAGDAVDPPRRLLLGSDAYALVTAALRGRLAYFEGRKDTAFSTDVDDPLAAASPTPARA
jgi:hypothetical protein